MAIKLERIQFGNLGHWKVTQGGMPALVMRLTDEELRDLVRQAALQGIYNRTGEPDGKYGTCSVHPDIHAFSNDPDPCVGWRDA